MRKILIPVMALLVLFVVAPVTTAPATKTPYTANVRLQITDPGKAWTTKGDILHVKGLIAEGLFNSSELGIVNAAMWKKLDFTLDTITGNGTMHGRFVLAVEAGTLEGSFRDKITDSTHLAGTVVGQGTGAFEGVKTIGTWEGDIMGTEIVNVLDAILLSPRG